MSTYLLPTYAVRCMQICTQIPARGNLAGMLLIDILKVENRCYHCCLSPLFPQRHEVTMSVLLECAQAESMKRKRGNTHASNIRLTLVPRYVFAFVEMIDLVWFMQLAPSRPSPHVQ